MYPRIAMKLCERSLYRVLTSIRLQCSTLSHATKKDVEKQTMELTSKKFPGYKLIYFFPYIAQVGTLNSVKLRFTYLTGAVVPVFTGLQLANVISFDVAGASICSVLILTSWLHTTAILCNNLVGLVYINLEEEKVILSYTDYWGKRIDLKTNMDDVIPLSDSQLRITDSLYKMISFASQKQKLKINMRFGKITDVKSFKCILGMVS
ncbi:PREDICTED: transmembrane protein 186 [Dinoponera quadriceps]|uniref:Transmembrane protein 186 n=1 Tax=Dinoponera quadriceps TaxID=609295 RepID=A0A6P3X0R1_DINQU|nr:PREDICTED: transmembrane protein 186 [Dinoponera quadriceps]XP_014471931.1 PREDICTED: transmembrane protein 186 [Dinoponera quadriceps]